VAAAAAGLRRTSQHEFNARGAGRHQGQLPAVFSRPALFRSHHPPDSTATATFHLRIHSRPIRRQSPPDQLTGTDRKPSAVTPRSCRPQRQPRVRRSARPERAARPRATPACRET
jgi:hypothetical protein